MAAMEYHLLEITLITAQGLKAPAGLRRLHSYAVAWLDPSAKLRTLVDRVGGANPTWNDRFLFRVPSFLLLPDSPSALDLRILADAGPLRRDPLVGSVRLLLANHRLLSRPRDAPAFIALGIRRPSGRFLGVLNLAAAVLSRAPLAAVDALDRSPAVAYRDLVADGSRTPRRLPPPPPPQKKKRPGIVMAESDSALKERNRGSDDEWNGKGSDGGGLFCGLGFQRKIHLSPSDQNLQLSWPADDE